MRDLWENVRKLCPYSYTTWKNIYLSLENKKDGWVEGNFYLKFWVKVTPLQWRRQDVKTARSFPGHYGREGSRALFPQTSFSVVALNTQAANAADGFTVKMKQIKLLSFRCLSVVCL